MVRSGVRVVVITAVLAIVVAGPAVAAHRPSPSGRAAIVTAVRQGIAQRFHRSAPAVGDIRVSSRGPWALARMAGPLFGVPRSIALVAHIGGRWTLVAESVTGGLCDVGESRAVDNDLGISSSFGFFDDGCSAPTTRTQSCGRETSDGYPLTAIRATHLTCAGAQSDALAWLGNIEYGRCGIPTRCRVHDTSPVLSFLCTILDLHPPVHPYRYSSKITCATPLQRFSFILNNRP